MATKIYKSDRRGKYPGCKIHMDDKDCQEFLDWYTKYKVGEEVEPEAVGFAKRIAKSIKVILTEHPDLLKERTPEQVEESLLRDKKKIEEQLAVKASGKDWKAVK